MGGRGGRCPHLSEVDDVFYLERCSSDDVLLEILVRLPLKSIFRFKCVSKRWHQLISNDYFRLKRIGRNKMDPGPLYFFQTSRCINRYYFEEDTIRRQIFLAEAKSSVTSNPSFNTGSSNYKFGDRVEVDFDITKGTFGDDFGFFICCSKGLLLCCSSHWIKSPSSWVCPITQCCHTFQHVTRYHIYNPLTKLGYSLPYSPKQSRRQRNSLGISITCKWWIGRECVGLVVGSSSTDDNYDGYKVVCVEASLYKNIIELEIFSSHTGEWRLSTVTVRADTCECFLLYSQLNCSVYVIEGAIYWMVGGTTFDYILVYNNNDNACVIEMINKPPCDRSIPWFHAGMGESVEGLLQVALVEKYGKHDFGIKIWVYHPQECRWLLRHQLPLPCYIRPDGVLEQALISFHPLNPSILFIHYSGCIFACHFNTTTPVLLEPLVEFNLVNQYNVIVQPYLPPPWPISPFPASQKR